MHRRLSSPTTSDSTTYTLSGTGGTQSVSPTATTIYTATATGGGATATATVTVTVNASAEHGPDQPRDLPDAGKPHLRHLLRDVEPISHRRTAGPSAPSATTSTDSPMTTAWLETSRLPRAFLTRPPTTPATPLPVRNWQAEPGKARAARREPSSIRRPPSRYSSSLPACIDDMTSDWVGSYGDVSTYNFTTAARSDGHGRLCPYCPELCRQLQ